MDDTVAIVLQLKPSREPYDIEKWFSDSSLARGSVLDAKARTMEV